MNGSEAKEFRVRAYMLLSNIEFLRQKLGQEQLGRIVEGLSPEARAIHTTAKAADWCPVGVYSEVLGAVAATAGGKEDLARDTLIASGEFVAREASNTFLRLLMRMLTPSLFAKKLPDLWKRDCSRGRLEVEVTDERLVCRMFETQEMDHAVCTGAGFVKFALESMGKSVQKVSIHNWSLAKPSGEGSWFEFTWKN